MANMDLHGLFHIVSHCIEVLTEEGISPDDCMVFFSHEKKGKTELRLSKNHDSAVLIFYDSCK